MPYIEIGSVDHEICGDLRICFFGDNKELHAYGRTPDGFTIWVELGFMPKTLLEAVDVVKKCEESGRHFGFFSSFQVHPFYRQQWEEDRHL